MRVLTSAPARWAASVEVPLALGRPLDYAIEEATTVTPGAVVEVSVGRRLYPAVVTAIGEAAGDRALKPIGRILASPLAPSLLELGRFVADYYHVTLGVAYGLLAPNAPAPAPTVTGWRLTDAGIQAMAALPARRRLARDLEKRLRAAGDAMRLDRDGVAALSAGLRRELALWQRAGWIVAERDSPARLPPRDPGGASVEAGAEALELTRAQQAALAILEQTTDAARVALLHGVTGSGKTAVFLALAAKVIAAGRQVLLLVPEINLTPQLTAQVHRHLKTAGLDARVVVMHSRLGTAERNRAWHQAHAGEAELLIGTRLAVFASLPRIGLIVVDEEHDGSYKQEEAPRYHARDVAVMRGRLARAAVVLASATPSLESWRNMRAGRYDYAHLGERATRAPLPGITLTPAHGQRQHRHGGLSAGLLTAIEHRLARGEQSLVLINRRGYAPALYCPHCAWTAPCRRCDAKLTWHQSDQSLRCHHCGYRQSPPQHCPACGHLELAAVGIGTQRVEQALAERFPAARVERADRDAMAGRRAWEDLFRRMLRREIDVLVGTQMLAKGHDFPCLTLVGVLESDRSLFSTDFRAQESLLALLTQVAGRAGRHDRPGEVIVQTDFPQHEVYRTLLAGDYRGFADRTLERRQQAGLPPVSRMALVRAEAKRLSDVEAFFAYAYGVLRGALAGCDAQVFPPQAAPLGRRADLVRWMMTLTAATPRPLQQALATLAQSLRLNRPRVRWVIDVDPYDFG